MKEKPAHSALTVDEVAEHLWISRSSARRLIVEGQIPSFKVRAGKRKTSWRVRREQLERWIASKEREAKRAAFWPHAGPGQNGNQQLSEEQSENSQENRMSSPIARNGSDRQ